MVRVFLRRHERLRIVLSEEQKNQLAQCVYSHLGLPVSTDVLKALIGIELATKMPSFNQSFDISKWVVKSALDLDTHVLLVQLIRETDAAGTLIELHNLVAKLEADPGLWSTTGQRALWVPEDRPFVDRVELRELLKLMSNSEGPGALVIQGGLGEGKSTICKYIEWLAREDKTFKAVTRALRAETADRNDLESLAVDLQLAFGLDPNVATTHAEPEREADIFASDIALEATAASRPVWLVIDGIDKNRIGPGVLRFIDELLANAQHPTIAVGLRVVLLVDRVSILGLRNLPPIGARKSLPQVTKNCLVEWFQAAAPGKPEALYTRTAESVLRRLEQRLQNESKPETKRLEWLARQAFVAHGRLFRTAGGLW